MTTLRDIGRRLGLSVTTVSRALNGFPEVGEDNRRRVLDTAREMNYRPNRVAQKLVSGRSGMVGLVLDASPAPHTYAHFFEVITGLSAAFLEQEMDLVLDVCAEGASLKLYDRLIQRGTLDGFILTLPLAEDPRIDLLLERDVPFVVHGRPALDDRFAFVDIDNHAVSSAAVAHLVELGHRRISLLNGPSQFAYAQERLRGYSDALAESGIPFRPELVRHGAGDEAFGAAAAALAASPAKRGATAFVCCNTIAAAGLITGLHALGLHVPGQVSVIAPDDGFPQIDVARFTPPMTVTRAPLQEASAMLADFLVRRIERTPIADLQYTSAVEFIIRASTSRCT